MTALLEQCEAVGMSEIDIPKSTLMQSKCPSMMTVEMRVELYYIRCTTGYRVYTCRDQVLSAFSTDSCFCALGTLTVTQFGSMPWFAAFFPLHLQHDSLSCAVVACRAFTHMKVHMQVMYHARFQACMGIPWAW